MFSNYLKLAWRVLGRKKFFTFISLFGISFTLAILMIIISFFETELGNNAPFTDRNRMLLINRIKMENMVSDTIWVKDSSLVDGVMRYDSTFSTNRNSNSTTIGGLGIPLLMDYFSDLKHASNYSIYVGGTSFNSYRNNIKVGLNLCYTDHNYWNILNYKFVEGRAYDKQMFENAEPVVVISEKLSKEYFGKKSGVLGEFIEMDGKNFKVIGVIKNQFSSLFRSEIFAPTTLMARYPGERKDYMGGAEALFLANSVREVQALKDEIKAKNIEIPMDLITDYTQLEVLGKTLYENYAENIMGMMDSDKAAKYFFWILFGFISLFVLLPTLNLINLNVSRIMERSSEIGVRKAFGASKNAILLQFVFENIILTIIGGIIGLIIALVLIHLINSANLLDNIKLSINLPFFLISFFMIIFFGIISGILPALKMSKLNIVEALKKTQL